MKSDYYLNKCLEQAELSPLSQHHGCVVVKGGKIIGKGFNDYRRGFEGSTLKSGRLSTKSTPLIKQNSTTKATKGSADYGFNSADAMNLKAGGVLSMHAEMMAINSALASSSTMAVTAQSHLKPPLATSPSSKHKGNLQKDIIDSFVRSAYLDADGPQVQQSVCKCPSTEECFERQSKGRT
jgi:deoxycytidylate deaminase